MNAAETVVDGEFPGRVRMAVQENALFHFAAAGAHGGDVGALLFGKQGIQRLAVKHKVVDEQQYAHQAEQDAQEGFAEKKHSAEDIAEGGKVKIPVERIRMYLKGLRFHVRTAAFLFQDAGKIFRRRLLTGAARRTPADLPADVGDLLHHVGNAFLRFPALVPDVHPPVPFPRKNVKLISLQIIPEFRKQKKTEPDGTNSCSAADGRI